MKSVINLAIVALTTLTPLVCAIAIPGSAIDIFVDAQGNVHGCDASNRLKCTTGGGCTYAYDTCIQCGYCSLRSMPPQPATSERPNTVNETRPIWPTPQAPNTESIPRNPWAPSETPKTTTTTGVNLSVEASIFVTTTRAGDVSILPISTDGTMTIMAAVNRTYSLKEECPEARVCANCVTWMGTCPCSWKVIAGKMVYDCCACPIINEPKPSN